MSHRRVRSACAAAIAFAALALSPGSAGAHPADCAGASALTAAPIAVSFADWTVDCTHATAARGSADSEVEQASSALEAAGGASVAATSPQPAARPADAKTGKLTQVGHEPLMDRGMNAAIAVHGDYAYIGSRTDGGHVGQPQGGMMVVDVSDPADPALLGPPLDPKPGESTRELRVWRSQDILIVLNTNCGVGPTLHHCTIPSISNIRFYDIAGANATDPKLLNQFERRHARVLPLGGPREPEPGADLRRQRRARRAGRRGGAPSCPFSVWDISRRAQRGEAGHAVQRDCTRTRRVPATRRAGAEADRRPALAHGQQRRQQGVLRAADRRVRRRRRLRVRRGRPGRRSPARSRPTRRGRCGRGRGRTARSSSGAATGPGSPTRCTARPPAPATAARGAGRG